MLMWLKRSACSVSPTSHCYRKTIRSLGHGQNLLQNNPLLVRTYADKAEAEGGTKSTEGGGGGSKKSKSETGTGTGVGLPAYAAGIDENFKTLWKKGASRLDLVKTPANFMDDRPGIPTTLPTKLTVNLVLPYKQELEAKQVEMVIIPATTGLMGVLPGHVQTIVQVCPGVLSVHDGAEITKYFVSSGFAFVYPNSVTDIVLFEGVPIEDLDVEEARKGLAEYTQKQSAATTDLEKAEAQIAIEVYGALVANLTKT